MAGTYARPLCDQSLACRPLFLHVLRQEFLRALPREIAGFLAVARALVAIEAVRRIRIGVDLGPRRLLLEGHEPGHRDAVIFFAEMHLHRALRLLVGELADHAAV